MERRARLHDLIASSLFQVHGSNPLIAELNETGDISNLCQFAFYEWIYYRDHNAVFPHDKERLGRCLGPARGEGNEMAQWVITPKATVVPRRTVRPLTTAELHSEKEKRIRAIFDAVIEKRYGNRFSVPKDISPQSTGDTWEPYSDSEEEAWEAIDIEDTVDSSGRRLNQQPAYDKMLNSEISLQIGPGKCTRGTVKKRAVGPDGQQRGRYDENPYLNSIVYEVEFDDGTVKLSLIHI